MSIIDNAFRAVNSDFYCAADIRDQQILDKFTNEASRNLAENAWLDSLPMVVLRDVERAIRGVTATNRKMNRDLSAPVVRSYVGRSSVSHRKARTR